MHEQAETKQEVMTDLNLADEQEELDPQEVLNTTRLLPEAAIPIPKAMEKIFETRYQQSSKFLDKYHKDWKKSFNYFQGEPVTANTEIGEDEEFPKENIVRTTVETLVDFTYMRNPDVEITALDNASKDMEKLLTTAVKNLVNRRGAKSLNLRAKMIKMIVYSHLSNMGILRLDFQEQQGSLEEAQQVYRAAQQKIKSAQDADEAAAYYDALDKIHEEFSQRSPFGITVANVSPFNLRIDPKCQNSDFSDADWIMEDDIMTIGHIRSEYMTYDETDGIYRFRYDPNVIFNDAEKPERTDASVAQQIISDLMPELDEDQKKIITEDGIPVVWVWDRATNQKYLYMQDQWKTPLWVWENSLNLSRFFPYFMLPFSTPLSSVVQRSEVSHYIPFQYEINEINRQMSRYRRLVFSLFLYDSTSIDSKEVDKLFTEIQRASNEIRALGVKLRDKDKSLSEALEPFVMPSVQFTPAFDKNDLKEGVQNQTRISEALRGMEFRTNTTNDAIATYNQFAQTRLDSLTDRIEQVVEELFWAICELIVSKFDNNTITNLVTEELAENFTSMSVEELNEQFALVVAAGSTEKPTSRAKKQEAMMILQILGQYGSGAPMTTMSLAMRMLRSAFSRAMVTDEDLKTLEMEGMANLQKGISQPGGDVETPPQDAPQ